MLIFRLLESDADRESDDHDFVRRMLRVGLDLHAVQDEHRRKDYRRETIAWLVDGVDPTATSR